MLTPEETQRYARHIVLRDVGGPGQAKLKAARVLVIGAGGLGAPILSYLAAAGIGTLGIVDDDTVSLSNLQRQVIHGTPDIGRPKVDSARDAIARINPHVTVRPYQMRLTAENAPALVADYDVVVDGCDNFATRFAAAAACASARRPLVSAAVLAFYGTLTVLTPYATGPDGRPLPGLADVVRRPRNEPAGCAQIGILGVVPGVLGTLAAAEVLKLILGLGEPLIGKLLSVDLTDMSFETLPYGGEGAGP
jgi:adenylyltransferase/sulfurtransferase